MESDDEVEAQTAEDRYDTASELAKPYTEGMGLPLEEALEAMRADGFDPDLQLPPGERPTR